MNVYKGWDELVRAVDSPESLRQIIFAIEPTNIG
jgi:hypothetical protein